MVEVWEQGPKEPAQHYASFLEYLRLGADRSVREVAEKLRKSRHALEKISARYDWVSRAAEYDRDQARRFLRGQVRQRREMSERHSRLAKAVQNKVVARLQSLDPERLGPGDLARLLEVATKLERSALGLPESLVGHTGVEGGPVEVEVAQLSEEDRRARLVQLRAELNRRLDVGDE